MEYIFGNVIGKNPKDGSKIQLNLSFSPQGDFMVRVICFCEVKCSSAKCSLHNELRMTLRFENNLGVIFLRVSKHLKLHSVENCI